MIHEKLHFVHFLSLFMKFKFDAQREIYDDFPRSPIWDWILDPAKTLNSSDHISENIVNQYFKLVHNIDQDFDSMWLQF